MTDTDDLLAWLRETLDAAEKRADRWHDVECLVHDISLADAVVLQGATLCVCDGPAAMLRRIAADRKTIARYENAKRVLSTYAEPDEATFAATELVVLGNVIRDLAEGWSWTDKEQR